MRSKTHGVPLTNRQGKVLSATRNNRARPEKRLSMSEHLYHVVIWNDHHEAGVFHSIENWIGMIEKHAEFRRCEFDILTDTDTVMDLRQVDIRRFALLCEIIVLDG